MLLPLGFGGKLKYIPLATILIAAVCVVWSIYFFEKKASVDGFMKSKDAQEFVIAKQKFITDYIKIEVDKCKKKQQSTASSTLCISKLTILAQQFQKKVDEYPNKFQKLDGYNKLLELEEQFFHDLRMKQTEAGFLSLNNLNILSMVRASFTHANYMHLISNLLFLLLFGIWVEKRIKALNYVCVYLLGSIFGFSLHLLFEPDLPVLGASAGIYALEGMFLALFFNKDVEFLFISLPFIYKKIFLPNKYILPLLFMVGEIAFLITGASTGVSHGAHVGGLFLGLGVGYFIRKNDKLPEHFIFEDEISAATIIYDKNSSNSGNWNSLNSILEINPQNWKVLKKALKMLNSGELYIENKSQQKTAQKCLNYLAIKAKKKSDIIKPYELLNKTPIDLLSVQILDHFKNNELITSADKLANNRIYDKAKLIYVHAFKKNRSSSNKVKIQESINKIELLLNRSNGTAQQSSEISLQLSDS